MNEIEQMFHDLSEIASSAERLEKRADARVFYELLSGSLVWSDELPMTAPVRLDCLRFVLKYRTGLLIGEPQPSCEDFWEEARRRFPNWIGFSPERTTYNASLARFYAEERERALSDEGTL
jgi:hypothetical protein